MIWVAQRLKTLNLNMFVRKKRNKSGTFSVVIVDKSSGKYRELRTIGVSSDESEINRLVAKGRKWIDQYSNGEDIFEKHEQEKEEKQIAIHLLDSIANIYLNGIQLIVNYAYDSIGFNSIEDKELRSLVTARLAQPLSKNATVEYLRS
ncbi:MAG TPA: hypothetical protein PKU98_10085 [Saprospiraceae bacterium]|nr:hypothetical protein [Saprospiraceae bacterium]HNA42149.1 hypothetical protein [Saprospiraceae bacterium]HNG06840.1 hypothetical protein [Saprospiraceae bacterium]HNG12601.1 hypothetical protein [Saprospiraceae bacterium]